MKYKTLISNERSAINECDISYELLTKCLKESSLKNTLKLSMTNINKDLLDVRLEDVVNQTINSLIKDKLLKLFVRYRVKRLDNYGKCNDPDLPGNKLTVPHKLYISSIYTDDKDYDMIIRSSAIRFLEKVSTILMLLNDDEHTFVELDIYRETDDEDETEIIRKLR